MAGHDGFTVTPRRGELIVFDKLSRPLVNHVLLPVPTETTKGVLVAPTVFGNVMLGPTAVDIERKDDTSSTADGLAHLQSLGHRLMPGPARAGGHGGVRGAARRHRALRLPVRGRRRRSGTRGPEESGRRGSPARWRSPSTCATSSTGAGLALRERPRRAAPSCGCRTSARRRRVPTPSRSGSPRTPSTGGSSASASASRGARSATRPPSPIPPTDLDGLRRRTRVLMGRCQGFFCGAHVAGAAGRAQRPRRRGDHGAAAMSERDAIPREAADVAIVGGGPAGLAAAAAARAGRAPRGSWCSTARPSRAASRATPSIRASGSATCTGPCRARATRPASRERRGPGRRRAADRGAGDRLGRGRGARADRARRPLAARRAGGGPGDRLPGAAALGPARAGLAARRG